MEATGFKKRLEDAQSNYEFVKLVFQYPSSNRAIIKSGIVVECYDDGFLIDEKFDGRVIYSYKFLVEVKEANQ